MVENEYRVSCAFPSSRYIEVEALLQGIVESDTLVFHLPCWRPGRYEKGNFARNIRNLNVYDASGTPLGFEKISSHSWKVFTPSSRLLIRYSYYAAQADAGACFVDEKVWMLNPVHFCVFLKEGIENPCSLIVNLPEKWTMVSSMRPLSRMAWHASDFHELVDSPVLCAPQIQSDSFTVNGIRFFVSLNERYSHDEFRKLMADFQKFTETQLRLLPSFPVAEFHFILFIQPYPFYHGVEHLRSTVLALGPADELMKPPLYFELLGVASHELFHVWNVKTLRPADFESYEYTTENYSRLGWVYEGFTTYLGDWFLYDSGLLSTAQFFAEIELRLKRHVANGAVSFQSLEESSYDTWLDGYQVFARHRKTSIYDEGALTALCLDVYLRTHSKGNYSLLTFFNYLYERCRIENRGYRRADLSNLMAELGGEEGLQLLNRCTREKGSLIRLAEQTLNRAGYTLVEEPDSNPLSSIYGFKLNEANRVLDVFPNSPAERAGLSIGDEYLSGEDELKVDQPERTLHFQTRNGRLERLLRAGEERYYSLYRIESLAHQPSYWP